MTELALSPSRDRVLRRSGVIFEPEPMLGLLKVKIHASEPDDPVGSALDFQLPAARREVTANGMTCAWLAPNEWLITGPQDKLATAKQRLELALGGVTALVVDLTHGSAAFGLCGRRAAEALAAHCPIDLSHAAFPVGSAARTLFGDANLFISRRGASGGEPSYRLIFDQTKTSYARRLLAGRADANGEDN